MAGRWTRGQRVDRFELAERVGKGAFGEVWRAHDPRHDRTVALKILTPEASADRDLCAALAHEATAALDAGPHFAATYEYRIDGPVYLAMEYVPGRSLRDLLTAEGSCGLEPSRAADLVDQIAEALETMHGRNLAHLDVTTSNVLVADRDAVYLVDLGFVGTIGDPLSVAASPRKGFGTLGYMAPERFRESTGPEAVFDVYGLACVLHECLTGAPAFDRRTTWGMERAHRRARRPRPGDAGRELRPFDAVVVAGLAVDREGRIPTATEFRARLRDARREWERTWGSEKGSGVSSPPC